MQKKSLVKSCLAIAMKTEIMVVVVVMAVLTLLNMLFMTFMWSDLRNLMVNHSKYSGGHRD